VGRAGGDREAAGRQPTACGRDLRYVGLERLARRINDADVRVGRRADRVASLAEPCREVTDEAVVAAELERRHLQTSLAEEVRSPQRPLYARHALNFVLPTHARMPGRIKNPPPTISPIAAMIPAP